MTLYHHILLVEDDPEDQYIFIESTKHLPDIFVTTARNGIEAIEVLSGGVLPEIIFLDLNMPKMHGLDFLKANAEENYFNGPIVVLSTSSYSKEREECLRWGAMQVYSKPDTMDGLARIVESVLGMLAAC